MSSPSTSATDTATLLVEHRGSGSRLMIPGAFEVRGRPQSGLGERGAVQSADSVPPAGADDRQRLEREREGGGAPSQRRPPRRASLVARLWRSLLHPSALPEVWAGVPSERV